MQNQKQRKAPISALHQAIIGGVAAIGMAAALPAQANLVNNWTGDSYTSGSWMDSVGGIAASASGSPLPVAGAFGTHAGVTMNGGYFIIPANVGPAGLSNFTVVVVFKPTAFGPFSNNYYNSIPLAAFDIAGGGQIDWGLSYGTTSGQGVVTGVGVQNAAGGANGDIQQLTPSLALNAVHAVAFQIQNSPAGTNITTYADGVMVASNSTVNIMPRSQVNTIFVGGGTFVTARFPGQIAAIQFYNDATNNAATLTSTLLTTYAAPTPITLPISVGADPGQFAPVLVGIPPSVNPTTITFTSDTPGVVATTNITIPANTSSASVGLSILGLGTANVTASAPGLGSATMVVAGLDESGLANQWLADTYVNNSTSWTDSIGGVVAAGTGGEVAVPGAFGPTHQGVARNAGGGTVTTGAAGFLIPAGTPPCNLSTYTVAVAFKPLTAGPNTGNYYSGQIMIGYDIGGAGQRDFGISWCGSGTPVGQEIVTGIGRSGGDSQIQSYGRRPLALGATHAACLQVNAAAGTQTLFVDGLQVGQNTGLTMNLVNSQAIPLIQQSSANIANAFDGLVAEVRIYTNATVNGAALTGMLVDQYTGFPPLTITSTQPFVDVGSNIAVTVTIPSSASYSGSFSVTLVSDTPGVVSPASPVTFAKGVTSQVVSIPALSAGIATLTASGSGVTSASLHVGGLAPRVMVEAFRASSLTNQVPGIVDGQGVTSWAGDTNGNAIANQNNANAPVFVAAGTPTGSPTVAFTATNQTSLLLLGASSPIGGFTNFSVALVFKASAPVTSTSANWYNQAGILDAEEGGVQDDWGITMDNAGRLNFGTGNPDYTLLNPNNNLVNASLFHVAVCAFDSLNQQMRITVDDQATTVTTPGLSLSHDPRDPSYLKASGGDIHFGQEADAGQPFWNGELVEADFYNGALTGNEATNAITAMKAAYGLLWADQALVNITASTTTEDIGSNITCTVTIPLGINATHPVTVTVTSSTPGVVALGGGATTNLTFGAGATNMQTFSVVTVGGGFSTLTGSSGGLISGTVTISVLPPATMIEAFRASSLTNQIPGIVTGQGIPTWLSDTNAVAANQNNANAPVFVAASTPTGAPSVAFNAANDTSLLLLGASSPVAGQTNFSLVLVFKANAPESSTSANWYSMSGILDAEEGGVTYDWGTAMDSNGNLNFGIGAPDVTLLNPGYNLVNSNVVHIAVVAFDELHQRMQITVDERATTTTAPGVTLSTYPRDPSTVKNSGGDIHFGQGADDGLFWSGELLEADFYTGAIKNPAQVIAALKASYNITFQDQIALSLTPVASIVNVGSNVSLTLSIPTNANFSQAVTIAVTNGSPSVLSLAGAVGGVLNVTFPAGGTNVQTILGQGVAIGTTTLTYGAPGYLPGAPAAIKVIEAAPNTLVGEWAFNDASHPFVDSSGFRPAGTHDGMAVGNVLLTNDVPTGLTGYSLNLMGTGAVQILNTRVTETGYLDTFDDLLGNGMTIAVWVKLNASWDTTAWIPFLSKRGEDNMGYQLRRYSTGPFAVITIRGTPGADDPWGLTAYEDGNWHHIAGVWDGHQGIRSLYVDGFLDANASLTGDYGPPTLAPTNSVVIGAQDRSNDGTGAPLGEYFLGLIKDVRIYNYPLTMAQVRTAMAGQVVGPPVSTTPPHLTNSVTSGNLNLSWPADHTGWRLLVQTNHLNLGISTNNLDWGTVPGSTATNAVSIPINPANTTEFYRLVYP